MTGPLHVQLNDLKALAKYSPEHAEAAIAGIIQEGFRDLDNQLEERRRETLKVEAEIHASQRLIDQDILALAGNHVMRALQDDNVHEAEDIWQELEAVYAAHLKLRTQMVEHLERAIADTLKWHNEECEKLWEMKSPVLPKLMFRMKDGPISFPSAPPEANEEFKEDEYAE